MAKVKSGCFQGVQLLGLDRAIIDQLKQHGGTFVDLMTEAIEEWCEEIEDMMAMAKVLNCEVWSRAYSISDEIDQPTLTVSDQLQDALTNTILAQVVLMC